MSYSPIRHKYNAIRSECDGIKFPSKLERDCYEILKDWHTRGKLRFFLRQVGFDLPGGVRYFCDYAIFTPDNIYLIEIKGRDLPIGKMKRRQVEELYSVDVYVATSSYALTQLLNGFELQGET